MSENKDINEIIRRLSSRLRVEMNGAVSATMRESGVHYRLNYGVSIPTIMDIAVEYRGDNDLAMRLYESQVRELRLAAIYMVDIERFSLPQAQTMREGITTREVAEQLALNVLSKADFGLDLALEWINDENENICYAAMMTASHILRAASRNGLSLSDITSQNILQSLSEAMDVAVERSAKGGMLWHGALTMIASGAKIDLELKNKASEIVSSLKDSPEKWLRGLASELEWQIE